MKIIVRIAVFIFLFLGMGQLILPGAAEKMLENSLEKSLNYPSSLNVQVEAVPAIKIIAGKIDKLNVRTEGLKYKDFRIEQGEMSFQNFIFEPLDVLDGNYIINLNQKGKAVFIISEQNLNDYLQTQGISGLEEPKLLLEKDKITLQGALKLLGREIPLIAAGNLEINEGTVFFQTKEIDLGSYDFGDIFKNRIEGRLSFDGTFAFLPIKMKIIQLEIEEKYLRLETEILP